MDKTSVRLTSVFKDAETNKASWGFDNDQILTVLLDGRVAVTDAKGKFVAEIAAPWAVDAAGDQLETHYAVEGTTLSQFVAFTSMTAFPVVADPTIRTYNYVFTTITLTKAESITAVSTVAACAVLFSKSPIAPMKGLAIGCGIFAAFGTPQLAGGNCLQVNIVYVPISMALNTWWPSFVKC